MIVGVNCFGACAALTHPTIFVWSFRSKSSNHHNCGC